MNQRYYEALGLVRWESCQQHATSVIHSTEPDWESLEQQVAVCAACELPHDTTQSVLGVGNKNAELMIIVEAPGSHEAQQGETFVGRAGQLLTAMIKSMGFQRSDVYIANILKCRPPQNRDPLPVEVATCTPYLVEQIAFVKPKLLLAVGSIAAHYLLQTKSSLELMRNQIHHYGDMQTPLIITYHPAFLLNSPSEKKQAHSDLQLVLRTLTSV